MMQKQQSFLIIWRDNIGDLVADNPGCSKRYGGAIQTHILLKLVNSYNAPAIAGNPFVDDAFCYTKGKHAGNSVLLAHWQRLKLTATTCPAF